MMGGTLASGATELVITQDSTQTFEIGSDIRINQGVTKTGAGTLLLSGHNVYTGLTEIQEGTLQVSGNSIGDTSLVTLSASRPTTLELLADETIGRLQGGQRATDGDYGTVAVGSHTLTINNSGGNTTYAGFFTGDGNIIKQGTHNLNLSNLSTGFTGVLTVESGMLQMNGLGQINAGIIRINKGGAMIFDNIGSTAPSTARILDTTPITLNSADGTFNGQTIVRGLAIRNDNDSTRDETVGLITLNTGASYIGMEATTANDDSDIIINNLVRLNRATLNVRGTNLGGALGQENEFRIGDATNQTAFIADAANLVGGGGAAASQNLSIVPWAIGEATPGALAATHMGNSLVTYVSGSGFRPLTLAEYNTFGAQVLAADNIRESLTAPLVLTSSPAKTVNALVLHNASAAAATHAVTGAGVGESLAITSGAMLFTLDPAAAAGDYGITLGGFDAGISVGATNEYVIHVVNPSAATTSTLTATISSPLTSNADITKSGRGTLVFTGVNTAGGGANRTTINEGILEIADLDNIGGDTGALVFAGGTLRLGTTLTDDISVRTITLLDGGGTIDTNGIDLALVNSVGSGLGGLTKTGLGNLTLNAAATYTGATIVTTGTLTIGANNATGNGGALSIGAGATLALGANSITASLVSTSGASPTITGAGTINASTGFFFSNTGDITVDAILAGSGGLFKNQTNVLTLTGLSTYTGTTEIQAGTLSINSISNVSGGASALGNAADAENGIIRMGLTTAATTLTYFGTGHASNRLIGMQGTTGGVTLDADGTGALGLGGARFENAGNKTLTLRGDSAVAVDNSIGALREIGGVLTLNKTDANTWVVAGASSYTGVTQIDNGTLKIGVNDALPIGTTVRLGTSTTAGIFDLNDFNQTIGSLLVQSVTNAVTNQIVVDTGKTLTINGAVTLGVNADASTTAVIAAGGGSIEVNGGGANFQVGGATGSTNDNTVTADFSGLLNFTANLGAGTFRIGDGNTGLENNASSLRLATNNTITAALIRIGDGSGGAVTHTLTLGGGTNALNADTINVGSAGTLTRSGGTVQFDLGDTTGAVTVRAADATGRAVLNMINTSGNTSGHMASTVDFTGHTADVLVGSLTMANRSVNSGGATATLSFDQGTLDVTTLLMASRTGAGTGNAAATVNLGDSPAPGAPTTLIGALNMAVNTSAGGIVTANFNVTGGVVTIGTGGGTAINMANAVAGRSVTSNILLTGGTTSVTGNIVRTGGGGTENAAITLNGGLLDLNANSIGSSAAAISLLAQSGTLQNLGELNGGASLTKTTSGTLVLAGINNYTGSTIIDDGILSVSDEQNLGANPGSFSAGHLTLNGGTLATTSTFSLDDANRGLAVTALGGAVNVAVGTTFTIGQANVISGAGSGALAKTGDGRMVINSTSTYTGATNVTAGVLTVNGSLGAGATTVAAAAALNGGSNGTSAGAVGGDLNVAGTFSAGAGNGSAGGGVGALNVGGNSEWDANANLIFDFASTSGNQTGTEAIVGTNWDYLSIAGTLNLDVGVQKINLYVNSWGISGYGQNGGANQFDVDAAPTVETRGGINYSYTWKWAEANSITVNGGAGLTGDVNLSDYFNVQTGVVDPNTLGNGVFSGAPSYTPNTTGGTFWVSAIGNSLYINYSSVPEPGSMILIGIAGLGMAGFHWSKRRGRRDGESEAAESSAERS